MANLITTTELTENTGIDLENTSMTFINTQIINAQDEIERRTSRTLVASDSDILTIKRAISFLTSYYIRVNRKEITMAKADLANYYRELKEFHGDVTPKTRSSWRPKISVLNDEDLDD